MTTLKQIEPSQEVSAEDFESKEREMTTSLGQVYQQSGSGESGMPGAGSLVDPQMKLEDTVKALGLKLSSLID